MTIQIDLLVVFLKALKVFEGRITTTNIAKAVPDFDAVHSIVIDAVGKFADLSYNSCRSNY